MKNLDSFLVWSSFREVRFKWQTFEHFDHDFRSFFGDSDFQLELRQEINRITQGEDVKVDVYLVNMWFLFDVVSPSFSEAEEISYVLHNMLPRLQVSICRSQAYFRFSDRF